MILDQMTFHNGAYWLKLPYSPVHIVQLTAIMVLLLWCQIILKQNNLLVICVVISLSLGLKDHLSPQCEGDPSATPNEVILPYSTPDEGCFVLKKN